MFIGGPDDDCIGRSDVVAMSRQLQTMVRPWLTLTNLFKVGLVALVVNVGMLHRLVFDKSVVETNEAIDTASSGLIQGRLLVNGRSSSKSSTTNEKLSVPTREHVSACLLLKDDNDILPEWLAYHYHTVRMRDLIVAVDPSSESSPSAILERWSSLTNLSVSIWSDEDFMPLSFLTTGYHTAPHEISGNASESKWHEGHEDPATVISDTVQILNHRFRQLTFLKQCLKEFHHQGKTWVMHVDTDEFLVVNPLLRNTTQDNVALINVPDNAKEPGSVLDVLNQYLTPKEELRRKINHPCVTLPRLLFGSLESSTPRSVLETLRWKYHTALNDTDRNAQPKVIVDVSVVDEKEAMFHNPFSIHRPSMRKCRRLSQVTFDGLQRFPLTVNHYVGSWERYNGKNDTRRSRRAYEHKAVFDMVILDDDWMESWLPGFLKTTHPVGQMLLEEHYGSSFVRAQEGGV